MPGRSLSARPRYPVGCHAVVGNLGSALTQVVAVGAGSRA